MSLKYEVPNLTTGCGGLEFRVGVSNIQPAKGSNVALETILNKLKLCDVSLACCLLLVAGI